MLILLINSHSLKWPICSKNVFFSLPTRQKVTFWDGGISFWWVRSETQISTVPTNRKFKSVKCHKIWVRLQAEVSVIHFALEPSNSVLCYFYIIYVKKTIIIGDIGWSTDSGQAYSCGHKSPKLLKADFYLLNRVAEIWCSFTELSFKLMNFVCVINGTIQWDQQIAPSHTPL